MVNCRMGVHAQDLTIKEDLGMSYLIRELRERHWYKINNDDLHENATTVFSEAADLIEQNAKTINDLASLLKNLVSAAEPVSQFISFDINELTQEQRNKLVLAISEAKSFLKDR